MMIFPIFAYSIKLKRLKVFLPLYKRRVCGIVKVGVSSKALIVPLPFQEREENLLTKLCAVHFFACFLCLTCVCIFPIGHVYSLTQLSTLHKQTLKIFDYYYIIYGNNHLTRIFKTYLRLNLIVDRDIVSESVRYLVNVHLCLGTEDTVSVQSSGKERC